MNKDKLRSLLTKKLVQLGICEDTLDWKRYLKKLDCKIEYTNGQIDFKSYLVEKLVWVGYFTDKHKSIETYPNNPGPLVGDIHTDGHDNHSFCVGIPKDLAEKILVLNEFPP